MPRIVGRNIEVGVALEGTRGTAETVADKWIKKTSATLIEKADKKPDENVRGVLEDSHNMRVVKQWVEGDIESAIGLDVSGYFFKNVFGVSVPSLLETDVYSHVFSMEQSIQHESLSIFMKEGSVDQQVFNNCMISSLALDAVPDDFLRATVSFMGDQGASNSDTPSYETANDLFIGRNLSVKFASTEGGLSGATAICAKSFNITFNQNLVSNQCVGSLTPEDTYNTNLAVEGSIDIDFDDETYKDLFLGDSTQYMQIEFTGTELIGATEYNKLTIVLNKVSITDWSREDSADEIVNQPISFKGLYNEVDGETGIVTIINNTVAYEA